MNRQSRSLLIFFTAVAAVVCACDQLGQDSTKPVTVVTVEPEAPLSSTEYPEPTVSGVIPLSVSLPNPDNLSDVENRPYFDDFSWRSFIALNWPADVAAGRGLALKPNDPTVFASPPAEAPTVWATYREAFELFGQGDNRPVAWNAPNNGVLPCKDIESLKPGQKMFVMANKGGTLLDEVNEAFSFPLIDQQLNYAYSEIRFNQAQYDFVRGQDDSPDSWLYLMKNLVNAQPVNMPESAAPDTMGSLMIKATWKILADGVDDDSRYYSVQGLIYDPSANQCVPQKVGLIGMHIVQKLKDFPEWIWSSFEQVDNIEVGHGAPQELKPSFNNGTNEPKTVGGYANRPPAKAPPLLPKSERKSVQVTRVNPIPNTPEGHSTRDINDQYQALLKGTPFEYYQLIITQWPTNPDQFKTPEQGGLYPEDSGQPFPVDGCTNTVMETYFQSKADAAGAGGNSCMSCHYVAGKSDFSWTLQLRAH